MRRYGTPNDALELDVKSCIWNGSPSSHMRLDGKDPNRRSSAKRRARITMKKKTRAKAKRDLRKLLKSI